MTFCQFCPDDHLMNDENEICTMDRRKIASVSLIIPCYNAPEKTLRQAIDSALTQTVSFAEILVIDDGSEPKYREILERVCSEAEKVRLSAIEKSGVSAARNTGISAAQGEYIAFLDADDVLAVDFLERAERAIGKTGADIVIGGTVQTEKPEAYRFPERAALKYECYRDNEIQTLRYHSVGPRDLIRFPGGFINRGPVARLIRSSLAKTIPVDTDLAIGEDIVWNLRLYGLCKTVCVVSEVWYCYRINPASATHRYRPNYVEDCRRHLEILPEILELADEREYGSYTDRIYEVLRMNWSYCLRTEWSTNRQAYGRAVQKIYTQQPWTEIGTPRFFRTAKGKQKIGAILYRLHFFFGAKAFKEAMGIKE